MVGEETKDFSEYTPYLKFLNDDPNQGVRQYYTVSDIKVLKVLKGEYSQEYIPIGQHAAIINRPATLRRTMLIDQGYCVMQKGRKYLLFLKKSNNSDNTNLGEYWPMGVNEGKFNIDGLDQSEITDTIEKDITVQKLRLEVLEKMKDQIQEFTK